MSHRPEVAILSGGISAEDYLSRRSAGVVLQALRAGGYHPRLLDWHGDGSVHELDRRGGSLRRWESLASCFAEYRPDVVFNALHGERENAGQLQGFMELLGIPLTGNGLASSVIGMDKALSLARFDELSVRRPRGVMLGYPQHDPPSRALRLVEESGLSYPLMLKRTHGGSSGGLEILSDEDELRRIWGLWSRVPQQDCCRTYAEEFIDGPEYCVTVFGHWREARLSILPIVEIVFEGRYFDKSIKFTDAYRVRRAEDLDPASAAEMTDAAESVHRGFGFVGFSRLDFRVASGRPYALEVNTHPGLSPASIVTNTLPHSSLTMEEAVGRLVRWCLAPNAPVEQAIATS